jgi:hypothetical protein
MANRVFVSFRNGDDPYAAALLFRALGRRFGRDAVFRSSDSIPPGAPWAETIWRHHALSEVLIAVIGPRWQDIRDGQGRLRLHQEGDWVRAEIAGALRQGKLVIPVVLDGIAHLDPRKLPDDIARIAELQAVRMDHRRIDAAITMVIDRIIEVLGDTGEPADREPSSENWLSVWNIPPRSRFSVDRDNLTDALRAGLRADDHLPVVLNGSVGTGKTHLAVEYAHRFAGDHHLAWWISAARPELIPAQFAALAQSLSFGDGQPVESLIPALFARLRRQGRWLLVFDGAEDPAALAPYLTHTGADVIITSRTSHWGSLPVRRQQIPGFAREESVRILGERLSDTSPEDLNRLAAALDDIPLAIAQAAAFVAESAMSAAQYADLVGARTRELLDRGETYTYPRSLAAAWSMGLDEVASTSPEAMSILTALSVLAAAPVPISFFAEAGASADALALADAVTTIARSGLISVADKAFLPNSLFQSFLRSREPSAHADAARSRMRRVLALAPRHDPRTPEAWPQYAALLPHVFALDLAAENDPACRALLLAAIRHLVVRADASTAQTLAADALSRWRTMLGPDAQDVLDAAAHLAQTCFHLGDFSQAAAIDQDVLTRWHHLTGPDDPRTLTALHNLAMDRWAAGGTDRTARLLEEAVAGRRKVLGPDHPDTIRSAHNLALALRETGEVARAHEIDAANRLHLAEALGPNHPDTLRSAYATALDLRALQRHAEALALENDNLTRLTALLGPSHPETLRSAYGVAVGLRESGDLESARTVAQETYQRRLLVLGDEHPDTLRSAYLVGLILSGCGETAAGAEWCARAERGLLALAGRHLVTRG